MDQSKSNASANGGKKEGNFFTKTAQSIRDKVQGLTNSNGAKKEKKTKEKKSKKSSKSNATNKADSSVDSDEEIATTKSESSPPLSAAAKNTVELEVGKVNRERTKPSTTASANPKNLPDKEPSSNSAIKSSVDHQDTATSPSSSSPTSSSSESSTTTPILAANNKDVIKKITPQTNNRNQIHLSFAGVLTVDDLRDRIDDAIEPGSSEKTPTKLTNVENKTPSNDEEEDEEPIRIDYNEIHSIDDILSKINQEPGGRRVIIENAPKNSAIIALEEQVTSPSTSNNSQANHVLPSTSSTQSDDPSAPPKSILKTSQNPSALDTSTRTSSFQDDQIHVNVEHAQGLESHDDPTLIEPTEQSQESEQNDEITPTPERNAAPSKMFSVSKAQVIEKHYDDYPSAFLPQTPKQEISNSSSVVSTQKTDENETTDWL